MGERAWKYRERRIASLLGDERIPVSGCHIGAADIAHDWLACEVKSRKRLPAWLVGALRQAERGRPYREAVVVMRLSSFTERFGANGLEEDDGSSTV